MYAQDTVKPEHLRPYFTALDDVKRPLEIKSDTWNLENDDWIQQDDNNKAFYMSIANGGLRYSWAKFYKDFHNPEDYFRTITNEPRHIIVVGAGMAGLSAAFELEQVGHKVTILELQHRVGGRAKTIYEGFSDGLHAEGGAMRLPYDHFMTKHYIDHFAVPVRPFQNQNKRGLLNLYGVTIPLEEWTKNNVKWCDKFWKGWDARFPSPEMKNKLGIHSIMDYYDKTVGPVIAELRSDNSPEGWNRWVKKYSKWSVESFLGSDENLDYASFSLRPWPPEAIEAYKVATYMPLMNRSLVEVLREEIGGWWKDPLYTPLNGMESLPKAFMDKNRHGWNNDVNLSRSVEFGRKVESITKDKENKVIVSGRNETTGEIFQVSGDAVLVTVPLTILRQLDVPLTRMQQRAIANINYEASTKILLQCRTRFWQKIVGQGGFTKTNQPIGQMHYPDWEGSGIPDNARGILLCYLWGQDALIMGSQPPEKTIASAVKQIEKIHPEIVTQFEVGKVQAWDSDQSAQGAFCLLNPNQYNDSLRQLMTGNEHPIYLAGEAMSWTHGWIQGAIDSGLRAAYEMFCYFETGNSTHY